MAKPKGITVADLCDSYEGYVFLYCDVCSAEYSATRGDYWNTPLDHVFTCAHGAGESDSLYAEDPPADMRLVRKVTRLVNVKRAKESTP